MKHTNYIYILLFTSLFLASNFSYSQTPIDQYLKLSANNNPELKASFNRYLAAMERLPQAKALPDPVAMFSFFTSPNETRVGATKAGLSLSQAFPWFGQLKDQEQAAALIAKARFQAFVDLRNKIFFQVKTTFNDVYVLEAAIRITQENITLLESFKSLANVRLEAGTGSAVDLLRVEMELQVLQNQIKYLEDSQLPLQQHFSELLNSENKIDIEIPDTLTTVSIDDPKQLLLDSIMFQNPSLRKLDFEIGSLEQQKEVARKMGLPSFSIGLGYTNVAKRTGVPDFSDNGKDALIFPQVGVRIPLYRKKYHAMVKEKELLQTAITNQKTDMENKLETSLEQGWRDYLDAQRRVGLYQSLASLADRSLDILLAEFTSAGKDFEEVLRMDRQLLKYELELEKARADQNTNVAFLNYLTGKN